MRHTSIFARFGVKGQIGRLLWWLGRRVCLGCGVLRILDVIFFVPLRRYLWDARSATLVRAHVIFGHASARIQRNREK